MEMTENSKKIALNPPDTIGRMVYRYDPVSFVLPYNSEFVYLKNGSEMNSLGKFGIKNDRLKINGINLSNPVKILHLSEEILISYWASGTKDSSTSSGGVFITDLSKNTTNLLVPKSENWAEITSSGGKIFVLEKYSPIITIYDFKGREIQTIEMPKSKFLKYEKRVRPPEYLQMPAEKKSFVPRRLLSRFLPAWRYLSFFYTKLTLSKTNQSKKIIFYLAFPMECCRK